MMCLFLFLSEGSCQRAAVLRDYHSGAKRFMSEGSHLGEDAQLGKRIQLPVTFLDFMLSFGVVCIFAYRVFP